MRRTDNALSVARSPLAGFVASLDELAPGAGRRAVRRAAGRGARAAASVFLASDAPDAGRDLRRALGGRATARWRVAEVADALASKSTALDGVANRAGAAGVRDAVCDLLLLCQCDGIVGSYWSSFSEAAALWRRVPLVVVDAGDGPSNLASMWAKTHDG